MAQVVLMSAALKRRRDAEADANRQPGTANPVHRRQAIHKEHEMQRYVRAQAAERARGEVTASAD